MIRYAVIENEDYAMQNLIAVVETLRPDYINVFCGASIADTLEWLKTSPPVDLIFMDVELNDGKCFELFRLTEIFAPVIFTTAYDAYLKNAFEANSIDYLLKPIFAKDLQRAIEKFERLRQAIRAEQILALERVGFMPHAAAPVKRIRLQQADRFYFLPIEDIAMLVSEDKYVFAYTFAGNRHLTGIDALRLFSEKLDKDMFFLVSRSCVVNINAVGAIHKYLGGKLKVSVNIGGEEYCHFVSAARRREFLAWLGSE